MPPHTAFTGSLLLSFSIFSLSPFSFYSKIMSNSLLCCLSADNGLWTHVFILSLPLKHFPGHEMLLKAQGRGPVLQVCPTLHRNPGPHLFCLPTRHAAESGFPVCPQSYYQWALHFSKLPWLIPVAVGSDQDCLTLEISLDHLSCGVGINFSHVSAILCKLP